MDLRRYFSSASSSVVSATNRSDNDSDDLVSDSQPPSPKKQCASTAVERRSKSRSISSKRQYSKKWEKDFPWLEYNEDVQGAFCKQCRKNLGGMSANKTGGAWISKPFTNWKKAVEKMKEHAQSNGHIQGGEMEIAASRAMQEGSVKQQLQQVGEREAEESGSHQISSSMYSLSCSSSYCSHYQLY